jgi:hypothetical protein
LSLPLIFILGFLLYAANKWHPRFKGDFPIILLSMVFMYVLMSTRFGDTVIGPMLDQLTDTSNWAALFSS